MKVVLETPSVLLFIILGKHVVIVKVIKIVNQILNTRLDGYSNTYCKPMH